MMWKHLRNKNHRSFQKLLAAMSLRSLVTSGDVRTLLELCESYELDFSLKRAGGTPTVRSTPASVTAAQPSTQPAQQPTAPDATTTANATTSADVEMAADAAPSDAANAASSNDMAADATDHDDDFPVFHNDPRIYSIELACLMMLNDLASARMLTRRAPASTQADRDFCALHEAFSSLHERSFDGFHSILNSREGEWGSIIAIIIPRLRHAVRERALQLLHAGYDSVRGEQIARWLGLKDGEELRSFISPPRWAVGDDGSWYMPLREKGDDVDGNVKGPGIAQLENLIGYTLRPVGDQNSDRSKKRPTVSAKSSSKEDNLGREENASDQQAKALPKVDGFVVVPITMPPVSILPPPLLPFAAHISKASAGSAIKPQPMHSLFMRLHSAKDNALPAGRTVYLSNVPVDATERHIKRLFRRCGTIEKVVFVGRNVKAVGKSGGTSHVIFYEEESAARALDMRARRRIWSDVLEEGDDAEDDVIEQSPGIQRWIAEYAAACPPLATLKREVNEYFVRFEEMEEARRIEKEEASRRPDADGFVLVTRGVGRSANTIADGSGATITAAKVDFAKKKHMEEKSKSIANFYKFQSKESKKKPEINLKVQALENRVAQKSSHRANALQISTEKRVHFGSTQVVAMGSEECSLEAEAPSQRSESTAGDVEPAESLQAVTPTTSATPAALGYDDSVATVIADLIMASFDPWMAETSRNIKSDDGTRVFTIWQSLEKAVFAADSRVVEAGAKLNLTAATNWDQGIRGTLLKGMEKRLQEEELAKVIISFVQEEVLASMVEKPQTGPFLGGLTKKLQADEMAKIKDSLVHRQHMKIEAAKEKDFKSAKTRFEDPLFRAEGVQTPEGLVAAPIPQRQTCTKCAGLGYMHDSVDKKHEKAKNVQCRFCNACKQCEGTGVLFNAGACDDCHSYGFIHPRSELPTCAQGIRCVNCQTCSTCDGIGKVARQSYSATTEGPPLTPVSPTLPVSPMKAWAGTIAANFHM
ncbi:Ribosomal RNA-processing protein 7 [Irineochytrium annulatum]|nr:Ribosomal RNA-processing protein 7 [Irineochytrium annulatum]